MFQHQHIRNLTIQQHFSLSPPRLAFLAWGDLTRARVSLALLSLRKNGDYSSLLYVWQNLLPRVKNPGGKKTNGNVLLTCVLSGANTLKSSSWTDPYALPMATWLKRTYIHTMPANISWRTHTLVWIECILARAVGRTRIWRAVGWHLAFTARSYIVALTLVDVDLCRPYRNP